MSWCSLSKKGPLVEENKDTLARLCTVLVVTFSEGSGGLGRRGGVTALRGLPVDPLLQGSLDFAVPQNCPQEG